MNEKQLNEKQHEAQSDSGLIPVEVIATRIYFVRGLKVILDRDLASLYMVETRTLKQAVRRNKDRFPADFMFELTAAEFQNWRSQFVTSNSDKMGLRHTPMAFTEQGVAMLSGVLRSERAVKVNIQIMRTFTHLRKILASHEDLRQKIEEMESRYDEQFQAVFEVIQKLLKDDGKPPKEIGFTAKEKQAAYGS